MDLTVPRHRRPVQSRARRCELRQRFYAVLWAARPETFDDFPSGSAKRESGDESERAKSRNVRSILRLLGSLAKHKNAWLATQC